MPFEFRMLDAEHPDNGAELEKRWPRGGVSGAPGGIRGNAMLFQPSTRKRHREHPRLAKATTTALRLRRGDPDVPVSQEKVLKGWEAVFSPMPLGRQGLRRRAKPSWRLTNAWLLWNY